MNITSRRTNFSWNIVTVSDGGTSIEVELDPNEAEALKHQLEGVIDDLDGLIEDYKITEGE